MDNDQAVDLLKKAVVRLKLINGGDSNCVHENADLCANHNLIHDIEQFLNLQEV